MTKLKTKRKSQRRKKQKKIKLDVSNMNLDALCRNQCPCCGARRGYKERYKKVKRLFRRESAYISR